MTTDILLAIFTGALVVVTWLYLRETKRLWEMARDSLTIDTVMRLLEHPPPLENPEGWKDPAIAANVAIGVCVSNKLGNKLGEIVATMAAVRMGKMTSETKRYYEELMSIVSEKSGLPKPPDVQ